jgi:hypothetical protein
MKMKKITVIAAAMVVVLMFGCGSEFQNEFLTAQVSSVTPVGTNVLVGTNQAVVIFDQVVNFAKMDFAVYGPEGKIPGFTVHGSATTTLSLQSSLAYGQTYTAKISGVMGSNQREMIPYEWSFTTESAPVVTTPTSTTTTEASSTQKIIKITPEAGSVGVSAETIITVEFDREIYCGDVATSVTSTYGRVTLDGGSGCRGYSNKVTIAPSEFYDYGITYIATVSWKNSVGEAEKISFSFTTENAPAWKIARKRIMSTATASDGRMYAAGRDIYSFSCFIAGFNAEGGKDWEIDDPDQLGSIASWCDDRDVYTDPFDPTYVYFINANWIYKYVGSDGTQFKSATVNSAYRFDSTQSFFQKISAFDATGLDVVMNTCEQKTMIITHPVARYDKDLNYLGPAQ